ncbi:uncharacterized protein [Clytia hemisphaerica]|uniref:uncharacterized protein n=1 Tax=Clytia hemisphaerica TaxID=252671 RepID=UPI0034D499C7
MKMALWIIILVSMVLLSRGINGVEFYISPHGKDEIHCGTFKRQCKTLDFVFNRHSQTNINQHLDLHLFGSSQEKVQYEMAKPTITFLASLRIKLQSPSTIKPVIIATKRCIFSFQSQKGSQNFFESQSVDFENIHFQIQSINKVYFNIQDSMIRTIHLITNFLQVEMKASNHVDIQLNRCEFSVHTKAISIISGDTGKGRNLTIKDSIFLNGTIQVQGIEKVVISNTTFQGVNSYKGVLIHVEDLPNFELHQCTFENNKVQPDMGNLHLFSVMSSNVSIRDSGFNFNNAPVFFECFSGWNTCSLTMIKSNFKHNTFDHNLIVLRENPVSIEHCIFFKNTITHGSFINDLHNDFFKVSDTSQKPQLKMSHNSFKENTFYQFIYHYGKVIIENINFQLNNIQSNWLESFENLSLVNSIINENIVENNMMIIHRSILLIHTSITKNHFKHGSVIQQQGKHKDTTIDISYTTFANNKLQRIMLEFQYIRIYINNSEFHKNTLQTLIRSESCILNLELTNFRENILLTSIIDISRDNSSPHKSKLNVNKCDIYGNYRQYESYIKEYIFKVHASKVIIENSNITLNHAFSMFECLDSCVHCSLEIKKSYFSKNRFEFKMIYVPCNNLFISNSYFEQNTIIQNMIKDSEKKDNRNARFLLTTTKFMNNSCYNLINFQKEVTISKVVMQKNIIGNTGIQSRQNIVIESSEFVQNRIKQFFIIQYRHLKIRQSYFKQNYIQRGSIIQQRFGSKNNILKLDIFSSKFIDNELAHAMIETWYGKTNIQNSFINGNKLVNIMASKVSTLNFISTNIEHNIASDSLFYIELTDRHEQSVSEFVFENNTATRNFAKIDFLTSFKSTVTLKHNNITENDFYSFATFHKGTFWVESLSLQDNKVSGIGKMIKYDGCDAKGLSVNLKDIYYSTSKVKQPGNAIMEFRLKHGKFTMRNISVVLKGRPNSKSNVMSLSLDIRNTDHILEGFSVACPINQNPVSSITKSKTEFDYQLVCQPCDRGLYMTLSGHKKIKGILKAYRLENINTDQEENITVIDRFLEVKSNFSCKFCPPGGDCRKQIKSQDSFYGFINKNHEMEFISCPDLYCCSNHGKPCNSFNTCNLYRTGTLCGSCKKGYYVNYFSNNCIPSFRCSNNHRVWFWFIYFAFSITLALLLCFTKPIVSYLKNNKSKIISSIKQKLPCCFRKHEQNPSPSSKSLKADLGSELCVINKSNYQETNEHLLVEKSDNTKIAAPQDLPFSPIFNILVGFYQAKSLLTIKLNDLYQPPTSFISGFFNIEMITNNLQSFCPSITTTVIYREFLKTYASTIIMLTTVLSSLLFTKLINRVCNKRTSSIIDTFSIGFFTIMAFCYKNLSKISFNFIHCVPIKETAVLYIAGDIECYTSWQIANFIFLAIWVLPFPIASTAAYNLHKKKHISVWLFITCLTFPIMTPFFYLRKKQRWLSESEEKKIQEKLYETFETPYKTNMFWWEAWRLYERLILSFLATYLIDPVVRMTILAPIITIYLIIHYYVNPYKNNVLTKLDLSSYFCLCLHAVINMFRSVVYIHSLPLQFPIDFGVKITNVMEEMFTPLWILLALLIHKKLKIICNKDNTEDNIKV